MDTHVTMTFLKTVVLSNIMQIISTYNNGPLHFHLLYNASENTSSDRDVAGEWTFLINVSSFKSLRNIHNTVFKENLEFFKLFCFLRTNKRDIYLTRCFESKTNITAVSHRLPSLRAQTFLAVKKDRGLFLKRTFSLKHKNIF